MQQNVPFVLREQGVSISWEAGEERGGMRTPQQWHTGNISGHFNDGRTHNKRQPMVSDDGTCAALHHALVLLCRAGDGLSPCILLILLLLLVLFAFPLHRTVVRARREQDKPRSNDLVHDLKSRIEMCIILTQTIVNQIGCRAMSRQRQRLTSLLSPVPEHLHVILCLGRDTRGLPRKRDR